MPNQFLSPEGDLENYFITEYWLIDQYVGDTLWNWGSGTGGQLGDNTITNRSTPVTTFAGGTNWKQVAGGNNHTAAIKTDGTLWTWGSNGSGQLGDGTRTQRNTPVTTFTGGTNWKQVTSKGDHTAAIKTDGTLWTWGQNNSGQIGNNSSGIYETTPVTTFAGGTNWKQVTCGVSHTAAIKTDGTLWTWGRNSYGTLGDNTTNTRCTPVTTFAGGTNWKQVAGGGLHTAAIKTDGTLWTWGLNSAFGTNLGALGDNTIINRSVPVTTFAGGTNWKQVTCGSFHTAAIKTDGTLWTWGCNDLTAFIPNSLGALGDNTIITRSVPVTTFAGGTNWKQVTCGGYHTSAIKTDGTLWTWGRNSYGNLGDNTIINRSTPVTTFTGGTNWKQVTCGINHTVAVTSGTDPTFFIS
jgi:alpha-tubulin suppressor-like RCC1 family protein